MDIPTRTITKEYGYFIRTKHRHGKKKHVKTTEIKPNLEKVKIAEINGLEAYGYPNDFPDRIFIGIYPLNIQIQEHQIGELLAIYNKCRWYLNGDWEKKKHYTKEAKTARHSLERSIDYHVDKLRKLKT